MHVRIMTLQFLHMLKILTIKIKKSNLKKSKVYINYKTNAIYTHYRNLESTKNVFKIIYRIAYNVAW